MSMNIGRHLTRRSLLGTLPLLAAGTPALGLARAARPTTRLVVPYPPGGTVDATARLLAPRAGETLAQTWVIENRAGANGAIGAEAVVRAPPDGTTLLYSNEVLLMLKHVQRNLLFDAARDLRPLVRTAIVPQILVGSPRHLAQEELHALLDAITREPTRFSFATPTLGSLGQLGAAALGQAMGVEMLVVAYRGTGPAVQDLLAGNVSLMIAPAGGVVPLIHDGQLRAYAVCSPDRIPALPEVPTLAEAGFHDLVFESWTGVWSPRGLPDGTAARVQAAIAAAVAEPGTADRIRELGCTPVREPPDQMAEVITAEEQRNLRLVQLASITPE
jgi:tripartite-type tricarboxylate transporter receptor subunit TctC